MTANKEPRFKIDIQKTLVANVLIFMFALLMISTFYFLIALAAAGTLYLLIKIKKKQFGGKQKNDI